MVYVLNICCTKVTGVSLCTYSYLDDKVSHSVSFMTGADLILYTKCTDALTHTHLLFM